MADVVVATDNFNRADGDIGANWAKGSYQVDTSRAKIIGQKVSVVIDEHMSETWAGTGTFTADQYAQARLSGFGGYGTTYYAGVTLRFTGTGPTATGYMIRVVDMPGATKTLIIVKSVNGTRTGLAGADNIPVTVASGDLLRAEVAGTNPVTIKVYNGSTLLATGTDATAPILAGKPGICGRGAATFVDDWSAGTMSSLVRKLRVTCDPRIAGATAIAGTVSAFPTGANFTGAEIGKFTGKVASATLLAGKAYFDVPTAEIGLGTLTLADTPVVGWKAISSSDPQKSSTLGASVAVASIGVHTATIIEE